MVNYFNYKETNNCISYEPYLYDEENTKNQLYIATSILAIGIIFYYIKIWDEAIPYILISGAIGLGNGLYRLIIQGKTLIEFNKSKDAFYKISPLGRQKKMPLSLIYEITTVFEKSSYVYHISRKDKPNTKSIKITSFVDKKRLTKPEFQFLENVIIPSLTDFLLLDNSKNSIANKNKHCF